MNMIPKVIHYCWFGRNSLPELAEKCISSWKKYCPDYEIIEWNEDNFDLSCCDFIREAYEEKKWAFVSDAARLFIIYAHGGVYLDTDVELIAALDPIIQDNDFYFGIEAQTNRRKKTTFSQVATGLGFGATVGHQIIKAMLDEYIGTHFRNNGELDMTACPIKNSRALKPFGFTGKNKLYRFLNGTIYPSEYFCPKEHLTGVTHFSAHTVSIHHYGESWVTPRVKYWMKLHVKFKCYLPDWLSHYLASYISYIAYDGFFTGHKELMQQLVRKIKNKVAAKKNAQKS